MNWWISLQELRLKLTLVESEVEAGLGMFDKNWDEIEIAYVCQELKLKLGMFANKMRIPLKVYGFHLQFADSTYCLRIPRTLGIPQQLNSAIRKSHYFLWIPQTVIDSANTVADSANCLILEQYWTVQCFRYLFVESKTGKKIKEK